MPLGSVGLLVIYNIFDLIREKIAHMDDDVKDRGLAGLTLGYSRVAEVAT